MHESPEYQQSSMDATPMPVMHLSRCSGDEILSLESCRKFRNQIGSRVWSQAACSATLWHPRGLKPIRRRRNVWVWALFLLLSCAGKGCLGVSLWVASTVKQTACSSVGKAKFVCTRRDEGQLLPSQAGEELGMK